jgi:hypothetical protein
MYICNGTNLAVLKGKFRKDFKSEILSANSGTGGGILPALSKEFR